MKYRREIDGLRAVAVVPVILFHAGFTGFSGGFVGVDVFFVISGYLITSIILAEHAAARFTLAGFYERRARRILPALLLVMACCVPFAWLWMLPYQLVDFGQSLAAVAVFSSNILFWRETGYFGAAIELKPLLHTWSLAVEEQYYLFFPPLVVLLLRWGSRAVLWGLLGIAVGSLLLAEWGWRNFTGANFFLTPTRVWELMIGALIAAYGMRRAHDDVPAQAARTGIAAWPAEAGGAAGLALIAFAVFAFDAGTPTPSVYTLLPTVGAALVLIYATERTWAGRLLGRPVAVGIGLISYSAYLWHQPLFAFARLRSEHPLEATTYLLLTLASLGLALASWRWVELPFRSRTRISRRAIFSTAAAGGLVMSVIGLIAAAEDGFVTRFPPADRYLVSFNPNEQGRYVGKRFDDLRLAPLTDARPHVFIVGDSYAQDFVNAYAENGYLRGADVATFHIASDCGAVMTDEDLSVHIPPMARSSCRRHGWFESAPVREHIRAADVVVLAAMWQPWQVPYVKPTIDKLYALGAKRVVVLGRKNFGDVVPLRYVRMAEESRKTLRNQVDPEHRVTNTRMREDLPHDVFVDVQALVCADDATCPVFTPGGRLISFDGLHFTQDGARYAGSLIFRHPGLAALK